MKTIKDIVSELGISDGSRARVKNKIIEELGLCGVIAKYESGNDKQLEYTEDEYSEIIGYFKNNPIKRKYTKPRYIIVKEQEIKAKPAIIENRKNGFYHMITRYGGIR